MGARTVEGEVVVTPRRHELTDEEWSRVSHHFLWSRRGRPPGNARQRVNSILWILCTGAPWRDLPERYGAWQTAYTSFRRWTARGIWKIVVTDLIRGLNDRGVVDNELWLVDGSVIRAHRSAAGAPKKGATVESASGAPVVG